MDPAAKEELEALEAIYGEDLAWDANGGNIVIRMSLRGNDAASWYSGLLEFLLTTQYPHEPPAKVALRHPRGLNEAEINNCVALAGQLLESKDAAGAGRLYDAIEGVREYLSKRSGLSLPCPICLHGFVAEDAVAVTAECSHHFHTYCLARYVEHSQREIGRERELYGGAVHQAVTESVYCPVCRTVIDATVDSVSSCEKGGGQPQAWSSAGKEQQDWSSLSNPIQKQYKELWEKQKRNGGLIDLQREKDRFLVTEHTGRRSVELDVPPPCE